MPSTITAGPDDVTHPRGRMALVARSGVTGEVAVHEALTRWVDDGWRRHARSESTAATRLHRHHGGEYPRLGRTVVEATHATHKPGGGPPTRGRSALPTRGSHMAGNIGLIREAGFSRDSRSQPGGCPPIGAAGALSWTAHARAGHCARHLVLVTLCRRQVGWLRARYPRGAPPVPCTAVTLGGASVPRCQHRLAWSAPSRNVGRARRGVRRDDPHRECKQGT